MRRTLLTLSLCLIGNTALSEDAMHQLPKPDYHAKDSDPGWLGAAAQFHGHLGPWATSGIRLGMAGVKAVGAKGYFDIEVRCEGPFAKPPKACFLDGLQVGTGATLGKRNLHWTPGEQVVVRVRNTRTGRQVEVRPSEKLAQLLGSLKSRPMVGAEPEDDHSHEAEEHHEETPVEVLARQIAAMPDEAILVVREMK